MDDDNIEPTDIYNGALDKSADLLEQQQAREQARLLQRFQELRRWQQQQQEQLLMQQQMQLSKLREEQMRAQTSFTKHRQQQWGSGKVKTAGLQTMPMSATKTPPKSRPRTVGSDLGSMLALLSSTQLGPDPLTPPSGLVPPSQDNVVKGLPRPVMYGPVPPFNDGDNSTNPDLFSNPASRAPSIISSDEGFFPIPDTASEFSHPSSGPPPPPRCATAQFATLQALLQKASPELFQQFMSLYPGAAAAAAASSIPSPQPPASFSQSSHASMSQANSSQLSSLHLHVPHAPALVGHAPPMSHAPQHPQHLNIPAASAANAANLSNQDLTTPPVEHPKMPPPATPPRPSTARRLRESQRSFMDHNDNCSSPVRLSDSRVDRVLYDQLIEEDLEGVEVTLASGYESPSMAKEEEYEEEFEDDDEEESALQRTVLEAKQQSPTSHPLSIDDRPIKPAGTKTFEQLLEEKLMEETAKEMLASEEKKSPRRPFLRKGQGLSRFEAGNKAGARSSPRDREARQHSPSNLRPEAGRRDPSASRSSPSSKTEAPSRKPGAQREPVRSKPPPAQSQAKSGKGKPTQPSAQPAPGKTSGQQGTRLQTQGSKLPPAAKPAQEPPKESKSAMVARQRKTSDESVLGEASFMARIKEREDDEKVEQEELEEFELLEDFADNVSFCSNSSVVAKLVQREQNKKQGLQTTDLKTIIEAKKIEKEKQSQFTSHQTPEVTEIEIQTEPNDDTLVEDMEDDDSYKTISDSEDDADAKTKPAKVDSWVQAEASFRDPVIFQNHNQNYHDSSSSEEDSTEETAWPQPGRHLVRKVATQESKFGVSSTDTRTLLQRLAGNPAVPVVAQPRTSKLEVPGRGGVVDKTVVTTEKLGARSARDRDSSSDSGSTEDADDEEEDEEKREKDGSEEDDTTEKKILDDPSTAAAEKGSDSEEEVDDMEFDDEDEWIDTAPKSNKAKAGKEQDPGTPPTSKLVSKLFPTLNNKSKQAQRQQQEEERLRTASQQPLGEGLQSRLLRDKLAELDREIEKFRHENQTLDKLRKDREEGITRLKQQIADFEKEKSEELARLEEFKAQEMKKLKHERKMFEKYQKTVRSMPDKKEREEIETLTKQLSELQEELRRKEARWQSSNSRLRSKLEEMEAENRELKEEIKLLEKKRLEWMQAQKEAGQKNGLRSSLPRSSTPTKEVESPARPLRSPREAALNHSGPNHHKFAKTSPGTVNGWPDVSHRAPQPSQHPFSSSYAQADPALHMDSLSRTDLDLQNSLGSSGSRSVLPRKQMTKFNIDNPSIDKGDQEYEETQHPDGKLERIYSNKAREILFSNGTRKEISSDGKTIVVSFSNGDIKQMFPDQRVVYYYAATGTIHTTYPDCLEVLQFKDNQVEKRYPDGTKEITFPDQTIKYLFTDGSEETLVPDGTMVRVQNGIKVITFTNGQREIHTDDYKRREFPDGTSKTVYPDGRQVTLFASRRKRVKDKEGNVVFDQIVPEGEPFDEVPRLPKFFMGRSAAF